MDWAIKAARKKTQRKPGSTRSIIETLDDLNNITTDAHIEVNHRLQESSEWLKSNVYINKLKHEDKDIEKCLISPENTHNKMNVEFGKVKEEYELSRSQNGAAKDVTKTPRNAMHNDKSITPKSLRRKEVTEEMNKFSIHDTHRSPIEPSHDIKSSVSGSEKSSPWSPFKVEKILRESSKASESPFNVKQVDIQTWAAKEEINNEPIFHTSKKVEAPKKRPQLASDTVRSQRRSNMFVPLPNKDPLIVQHIPPIKSSGSIAKLRIAKGSPTSLRKKSAFNSPVIRATENNDTVESTKASSVFDRLSSIPTKSFENKISRGNAGHKYSSSSIDLTGSPMRKNSQNNKTTNSTDTDMQETLRDIFSVKSKIENNTSPKGNHSRKSSIPRFDKTSLKSTTQKKLAIIAEQKKQHKHFSVAHKTESRPRSISPMRINTSSNSPPSKDPKSRHQSPVRGYLRPTKASISPNKSRNPLASSQTPHRLRVNEKSLRKQSPNIADTSKPESRKSKNYRLTNLQLLPPAEAERGDLKKKFDKRLSGIMRSQQEHHRRKQEKQKRMSHLEQDLKKQTSFSNDYKDTRLKDSLPPFDNRVRDPNHRSITFNTENILATINTVDHREIIGNVTPKVASANDSLPEINTDSEDEASVTLAAWAKSPYLQEQLIRQHDINPQTIFGPIPPLHTDEIFPNPRLNRLKSRQIVPKRP